MNWWLVPVIVVFVIGLYSLSQKAKTYVLMQIVKNQILKDLGGTEEWIIQGYNILYAFIAVPILFMAVSLFTGTPYEYRLLYSIVFYASTFMIL